MRKPTPGAALGAVALALVACSGPDPSRLSTGVTADDTTCEPERPNADAGRISFEVNNRGTKVTEFSLHAEGDRVLGTAVNIAAGTSRTLTVDVPAGKYTVVCGPGMRDGGVRSAFTVNGEPASETNPDTQRVEATANYHRYVVEQTEALLATTTDFVTSVKAGRLDEAKSRYPVARTYWERIEPVTERLGDLGARIDAREDTVADGGVFTGFHRLERDLWATGPQPDTAAVADTLLADIRELLTRVRTVGLTAGDLADGARELITRISTGGMTGEQERYSHTDLWDIRANLEGARVAVAALRPLIRDPDVLSLLDTRFAEARGVVALHHVGDDFRSYLELTPEDVRNLAAALTALIEPLDRVATAVG